VRALAIFPPLTANETAVLEVLASDSAGALTAGLIAEKAGLGREQADRALRSLESREPPLVGAEQGDGGARWTVKGTAAPLF
jgi:hypothetical protein